MARMRADHLLDSERLAVRRRGVGPRHDVRGARPVGERPTDDLGELFVVNDGVRAFAGDHLGQRRSGERGVQQQQTGADAVRRDDGFDEAAMIAVHDADHPRLAAREGLQRCGERVAPLVDFTPGQRPELVDEPRPIRTTLCGGRETRYG